MSLTGPGGHPTPPSGVGQRNSNSMEGVGVGGQTRLTTGGADNDEYQQQMWREVRVRRGREYEARNSQSNGRFGEEAMLVSTWYRTIVVLFADKVGVSLALIGRTCILPVGILEIWCFVLAGNSKFDI